jgi:hypothetical protein
MTIRCSSLHLVLVLGFSEQKGTRWKSGAAPQR